MAILFSGSIFFIVADIYIFTQNENYFTTLFLTTIVLVAGLFILNQSILLSENASSKVYQNLSDKEIEQTWLAINKLIREKEFYADENLTLSISAHHLNTTSNLLSFILNKKGTNFKALLNTIRIEKAIELLAISTTHNYSIEGIGREVGYKSKTTFYKHFKAKNRSNPKCLQKKAC